MSGRSGRVAAARGILAAVAFGSVLVAGCAPLDPLVPGDPVTTGSADFTRYVNLGTGITAGVQSGGWTEEFQRLSVPQHLARQVGQGADFTQPLLPSPGLPPVLELVSLSPLVFAARPGSPPTEPITPRGDGYDNLAIPSETVGAALAQTSGGLSSIVLQGHGTALRQALAQAPTFVSVELGANEVLAAVRRADPAFLLPAPQFAARYVQLLDSLATGAPGASLALMNVPDPTALPFATSLPLDADLPIGPGGTAIRTRLRDAAGPLPDGSLLILLADSLVRAGYGGPEPAPPLPDSVVITPGERAAITSAVDVYNAVIAAEAAARGAAHVDARLLYAEFAHQGAVVAGVRYTAAFPGGGLFSLDGIHLSSLGQGLLANAWIAAVNRRFGALIPPVDAGALARPTR